MSDFTERVTRKNKNNETDLALTISSKDGLIAQENFFNKLVSSKDMSGYYLLKNGEFAYNKSYSVGFDFGSIKRLELYPQGALSTLYICFSIKSNNSTFIRHYFDSLKWYKEVYMIAAEGARNHGLLNIPTEQFFETLHTITDNKEEQEKIAKFLSLVDERIEKQRQLVENLKIYKRGLFNKIFNSISGDYITLENILIEVNEKSKINNEYPIISSTKQGLFLQSDYFNKQAASENTIGYKILRKGQIVFSPQNLWMGNINYNSNFEIGIVSPSYKIYKISNDFNPYFIGVLLKEPIALREYMLASEQGASIVRRNLNIELFNNIKFKIPKFEIQNKFANVLQNTNIFLDNEEQYLSKLNQYKNGLLQQMFI